MTQHTALLLSWIILAANLIAVGFNVWQIVRNRSAYNRMLAAKQDYERAAEGMDALMERAKATGGVIIPPGGSVTLRMVLRPAESEEVQPEPGATHH